MERIEDRVCTVTHNGETYTGEVRQINPRVDITVWVPTLNQSLEMDWNGHGDDYSNSSSSVTFYFRETVNRGRFSSEKVTKPKRTSTN